jgi:branched-chain amino acid transport system ATP-binding protein
MSLEVSHCSAAYGSTPVLRDVTLTVPPGRVVALIGPNGAGKTTLLRLCSGLLPATTGQLLLDGDDVTAATPHELVARGVCHVPEGRGIFPSLSVRENLSLYRRGDPRARGVPGRNGVRRVPGRNGVRGVRGANGPSLDRAVDAFPRLGERLDQVAGTMSGGEQQMLALARTLVTSPRYVLLDEVSMGLAPRVVEEIFEFLRRLAEQGVALLLVEQYVQQALAMADLVYILRKGRVAFAGEPDELDVDAVAAEYLGAEAPAAAGGSGR